jgi:uncharacterized C2H2 Zn-finger protein
MPPKSSSPYTKAFPCPMPGCRQSFDTQKELETHVKDQHTDAIRPSARSIDRTKGKTKPVSKPVSPPRQLDNICPFCNKGYKDYDGLYRHVLDYHRYSLKTQQHVLPYTKQRTAAKGVKCQFCGNIYGNDESLYNHMLRNHGYSSKTNSFLHMDHPRRLSTVKSSPYEFIPTIPPPSVPSLPRYNTVNMADVSPANLFDTNQQSSSKDTIGDKKLYQDLMGDIQKIFDTQKRRRSSSSESSKGKGRATHKRRSTK